MSESFGMADWIIYAAIAGFILFRLYSVLGRRTGHEGPPPESDRYSPSPRQSSTSEDNIITLPQAKKQSKPLFSKADLGNLDASSMEALEKLSSEDAYFDPAGFVTGAEAAYGMVVEAFAKGDRSVLQSLVSEDVQRNFDQAIRARDEQGQTLETKIAKISKVQIEEAAMAGEIAEISIRFESELIHLLRDSENRVIEGDPTEPVKITEIWTFARNTNNRDPNWTLIATEAVDTA